MRITEHRKYRKQEIVKKDINDFYRANEDRMRLDEKYKNANGGLYHIVINLEHNYLTEANLIERIKQ